MEPAFRGLFRRVVRATRWSAARSRNSFFKLSERQLDRIEIGRVGRQVAHAGSDGLDRRDDAWTFVAGEIYGVAGFLYTAISRCIAAID